MGSFGRREGVHVGLQLSRRVTAHRHTENVCVSLLQVSPVWAAATSATVKVCSPETPGGGSEISAGQVEGAPPPCAAVARGCDAPLSGADASRCPLPPAVPFQSPPAPEGWRAPPKEGEALWLRAGLSDRQVAAALEGYAGVKVRTHETIPHHNHLAVRVFL